ncbi:MAG: hypothetical protein HG459_007090 [Bacteroidia bacterium]|nr:hypothetical protein [Bacteroidia bacterium]
MKKKHAERSLTGLLAAWLLLMAVWLVPGSAWARIAPNGGEATPARGAYETLVEMDVAMRGVSTAAPREREESVAEGQREGVPTGVGALRPAYAAERTSPTVSARAVKPRAPSGNGPKLHFFLDSATQEEPNMRAQSLFAKSVGGGLFASMADGKDPVMDSGTFPKDVGHFAVGYFIGNPNPSNISRVYFKLKSQNEHVFELGSVAFEITVVANGKLADLQGYHVWKNKDFTIWKRNYKPGSLLEGDSVNVYIHKIRDKIPLQIKHYVDGREISAPDGLDLVYDQVRKVGWVGDGMKVPYGATLQYSWEHGKVQVDGVAMRPKQIKSMGRR